jgi:NTP pyrophosphatase (non-canonical NTP hydrolase)
MPTDIEYDYADFVSDRLKPAINIYTEFTLDKANLVHCILGISGEAGELLDAIKKNFAYGKNLDEVNVIEELGDIEFYLEGLRQHLNLTRSDVIKFNMEKLKTRYPKSYSDKLAQQRKDKE